MNEVQVSFPGTTLSRPSSASSIVHRSKPSSARTTPPPSFVNARNREYVSNTLTPRSISNFQQTHSPTNVTNVQLLNSKHGTLVVSNFQNSSSSRPGSAKLFSRPNSAKQYESSTISSDQRSVTPKTRPQSANPSSRSQYSERVRNEPITRPQSAHASSKISRISKPRPFVRGKLIIVNQVIFTDY
jgi:hypothetical protein